MPCPVVKETVTAACNILAAGFFARAKQDSSRYIRDAMIGTALSQGAVQELLSQQVQLIQQNTASMAPVLATVPAAC